MLESPTKKVFYLAGDIISSVSPAHINMQRISLAFDSRAQYQRRNINLHVSAPRLVAVNHLAVVLARLILMCKLMLGIMIGMGRNNLPLIASPLNSWNDRHR